jgi:hypothetical protein
MEAAYGSFSEKYSIVALMKIVPGAQAAFGVMPLENNRSGRICASHRDHRHHDSAGTAAITAADELGSQK